MSTNRITTAPDGESSVNPVIFTENAADVITFIVEVFGGKTDEGALTYDEDGTIFHSETSVDKTKFIIAERKKDWPFTPAFTQVYVTDVEATIKRAEKLGAKVITEPTEYVGVHFARVQDPQGNIWWIWKSLDNYDWEAAFSGADEGSWKPTKEAVYVHDSLVRAMEQLAEKS